MIGNPPFKRLIESLGGSIGKIQTKEVTHGSNGWDPHIHALLFLSQPISQDAARAFEAALAGLWRAAVARYIGQEYVPTLERGVRVTPCHDETYIQKFALELTAPAGKSAYGGNRTPWDILEAIRVHGRDSDKALWRDYGAHMRGKAQLFWSPGLKERLRICDKSDEAIVAGEEQGRVVIAGLPNDTWDILLKVVPNAELHLRELAEDGDFALVDAFVFKRTRMHARPPPDPDEVPISRYPNLPLVGYVVVRARVVGKLLADARVGNLEATPEGCRWTCVIRECRAEGRQPPGSSQLMHS
jgi:hypothetical protein